MHKSIEFLHTLEGGRSARALGEYRQRRHQPSFGVLRAKLHQIVQCRSLYKQLCVQKAVQRGTSL